MARPHRLLARWVAALTTLAVVGITATATARPATATASAIAETPPTVAQDPLTEQVDAYAATVGRIAFTPCGELQCGTLTVPLDYRNPSLGTTTVTVKRRPASLGYGRRGVILVNPGGPGASAASAVPAFATVLGPTVREQFDIVGVDPRGVVTDQPHCTTPGAFPYPLDVVRFPTNSQQDAAMRELDQAVAISCRYRPPRLLGHMSTADAARDLDVARQALGESKVWFYGTSYGTHLGRTYATLYPRSLHGLVLDGVVDSVAWTTGRNGEGTQIPQDVRLDSGLAGRQALDAAIVACENATPVQCPTQATLRNDMTSLLADLKKLPLLVPVAGQTDTFLILTYDVLLDRIHRALYDGRTLHALFTALREIRTTAQPVEPEPHPDEPHPTLTPIPPSVPSDPPPAPLPTSSPVPLPTSSTVPSETSAPTTEAPLPTTSRPTSTSVPVPSETPQPSAPPGPTSSPVPSETSGPSAPSAPVPTVTRVPQTRARATAHSTGAWEKLEKVLERTSARPLAPVPPVPTGAAEVRSGQSQTRSSVESFEDSIRVTMQAVACGDAINPQDPNAWYTRAEQSRQADDFTQIWLWQNSVCGIPGVFDAQTPYQGGFARADGPPILLLNTTHDPATPLSGAQAVRAEHPNSRLITVPWWGHGVVDLSTCANNYRALFLHYGYLPSNDVRCNPDVTLLPSRRAASSSS